MSAKRLVSLALRLFGVATVAGNLLGGRPADWIGTCAALQVLLSGRVLALLALLWTASHPGMFVILVVRGVFTFAGSPVVQAGVPATSWAAVAAMLVALAITQWGPRRGRCVPGRPARQGN